MTIKVPDFARLDPPARRVKGRWGRYKFAELPEIGCDNTYDGRDFAGESSPCTGIAACECCQLATYPRHSDYERRTNEGARFVVPIVICPNCADSVRNRHVPSLPMNSDLATYLNGVESGAIPAPFTGTITYAAGRDLDKRDVCNVTKLRTPTRAQVNAALAVHGEGIEHRCRTAGQYQFWQSEAVKFRKRQRAKSQRICREHTERVTRRIWAAAAQNATAAA